MIEATGRICEGHLVDFLDAGVRGGTGGATSAGVQFLHNGVSDDFELPLPLLVFLLRGLLRVVEPRDGLVNGILKFLLVSRFELAGEFLVGR